MDAKNREMTEDYRSYRDFMRAVNDADAILFYAGHISVSINKEQAESVYTRVIDARPTLGRYFRYIWTLEDEGDGWNILHIQLQEVW